MDTGVCNMHRVMLQLTVRIFVVRELLRYMVGRRPEMWCGRKHGQKYVLADWRQWRAGPKLVVDGGWQQFEAKRWLPCVEHFIRAQQGCADTRDQRCGDADTDPCSSGAPAGV